MPFILQEPGLLWLAAAAAVVPLAAHLVARTRPPETVLPTAEFLRRAMKRVWRIRRPQDWLMLLLRTLALVALAIAFARPLRLAEGGWSGGAESKHLVLVVDRTASMAGGAGGQSRFSVAKARALEALRGAGRLDSVNLVWMDAAPDAVHPGMGTALEPVEAALREAEVAGEPGTGAAALALAAERLEGLSGAREIVVVSDFQTGSWADPPAPLPESIRLVLVPVGEAGGNLSLAQLETSATQPLPGESVEVLARVLNHGDEPRRVRVAFTSGSQRQTRDLEIEGGGEGQAAVEFELPDGEDGEIALRAALEGEGDALPGDDARWVLLKRREPLRVALAFDPGSVSEEERGIWSRLLRSIPWTREVGDGEAADLLVAAGPADTFREAADAVLARGGGVVFRPTEAAGALPEAWSEGAAGTAGAAGPGRWEKAEDAETGWRLRIAAETDPLLALFASGEYGNPVAGTVSRRWRPDPGEDGASSPWAVPIRYEDGVAAVRRKRHGGGTLWWWNLPLDPALSTWARQPAFLPLVGEALLLSRPDRADPAHWRATPGGAARWEPSRFPDGGEVVLLDESGAALPIAEDAGAAGLAWRSAVPLRPGLHRWALRDAELGRDTVLAHTVVNFPESEMDDRAVDPAGIAAAASTPGRASASAKPDWAALRDGVPLWPWFVAAALAFFALEAALLGWHFSARLRRDPSPHPDRSSAR